MKKSSLIGMLTLLFLAYISWLNYPRGSAVCDGERLISDDGAYSYIFPEGWVNRGSKWGGLLIVNPEIENGINANIHISTHETDNEESREQITERIMSEYEDITLLEAEVFETDVGAPGSVIYSVRTNALGIAIHRSHYILPHPSGGGVVVVAGTCADIYKDKYEPFFRGVAKSIRGSRPRVGGRVGSARDL
jgi:hypothetical protein